MRRSLLAVLATAAAMTSTVSLAADTPTSWDGLTQVKSKRLDAVFLLPDADFRTYTKVILDPPESAFRKNWVRDYNRSTSSLGGRVSEKEAQQALQKVSTGFAAVLAEEYQKGGYQVVTEPGADVIRIRTGVINLSVNAPDVPQAGRVTSYSQEAGQATLVVEVRDSVTNALLGRALDRRIAGDTGVYLRNSVTNWGDFRDLFKTWARASITGLNTLKEMSPINVQSIAK
jgi:hypothetical protein